MTRKTTFFLLLVVTALLSACGAQKKTWTARTYHSFVSYFNGYYHANLNYEKGVAKIEEQSTLPSDGFIPLMTLGEAQAAQSAYIYFDTAIVKNDVIIYKHPNGNWVDDCRFLTGRCHFYKGNYSLAIQNFKYVLFAFEESDLIPEVKLWLAKTYFVNGNEIRAQETLADLPQDIEIDRRTQVDIAEMRTTLLMRKDKYSEALAVLQENFEKVRKRDRKAKWHHLMGQLYAELGENKRAFEHFEKCARLNTSNELVFLSRLRSAGLFAEGADPSPEELQRVKKTLNDLLEDAKYVDYQDQIYYKFAELERGQGNYDKALEYLQKSLDVGGANTRQKVMGYYATGEIYFYQKQNFTQAQAYFDSAATMATQEMPEYEEIQTFSKTLRKYVDYRNTIHLQDSLLLLAELSPEEQRKRAEKMIEEEEAARKRAEEARQREMAAMNNRTQFMPRNNDPFSQGGGGGFYFDDQSRIARGKAEFRRIWGNRPNEDHWRRKNKQVFARNQDQNNGASEVDSAETKEEKIDRYVSNIPASTEEKDSANAEIQKAYFGLGQIYANKFELPDSAVVYYQMLLRRYPASPLALKSKYAIYTLEKDRTPVLAGKYKKDILENHPNSLYARLIRKEDVSGMMAGNQEDFQSGYNTLRDLYDNGDCETVVNFSTFLIQEYSTHPEVRRMHFIRGLCFGKMGQEDSLRKIFSYLISAFPDTDVSNRAQRTLAYLDNPQGNSEATDQPGTTPEALPQDEGSEEDLTEEEKKAFKGFERTQRSNEPIFAVIFVPRNRIKSNELNARVSDFHRQYYQNENLRSSVFVYKTDSTEFHMVYISQFPDYPSAFSYVKVAREHNKFKAVVSSPQDDILFISPANFRIAFSQRRFHHYRTFFKRYREEMLKSSNEE